MLPKFHYLKLGRLENSKTAMISSVLSPKTNIGAPRLKIERNIHGGTIPAFKKVVFPYDVRRSRVHLRCSAVNDGEREELPSLYSTVKKVAVAAATCFVWIARILLAVALLYYAYTGKYPMIDSLFPRNSYPFYPSYPIWAFTLVPPERWPVEEQPARYVEEE